MSKNNTHKEIKKLIENTFNEVSTKYDTNLFFKITAEHMAKSFNSKDNMSVLDVSTGTGTVIFELLNKHPHINIHAVDISKGMLDIAKNKALELNYDNIIFKHHDVEKLQYPNHHFDLITCGFGLFFYPNMSETFNTLCQMIKEDGKFIFSSFTKDAFAPYSELFFDRLENDYKMQRPIKESGLLNTNEDIKLLVNNINDYSHTVEEVEIAYNITIMQWWELLNSAGYKTLLNKLGKEELLEFKQNHLNDIKKLSKDGNIKLHVNTLITTVSI